MGGSHSRSVFVRRLKFITISSSASVSTDLENRSVIHSNEPGAFKRSALGPDRATLARRASEGKGRRTGAFQRSALGRDRATLARRASEGKGRRTGAFQRSALGRDRATLARRASEGKGRRTGAFQ